MTIQASRATSHLDMDGPDIAEVDDARLLLLQMLLPLAVHIDHGQGLRQHKKKVTKVDACLLNGYISLAEDFSSSTFTEGGLGG
jgi:fructose/tagatose bisphosphate aldolase